MKKILNVLCTFNLRPVSTRLEWWHHPANINFDEDVLRTSFVFDFRRRLDQDEYIHLTHTSSEDVFKTSWSRAIYSSWSYVFKTSCQDVFKTSSRHLEDVFKISPRRLAKTFSRRLQNVFKTSCKIVLFSRRFEDIFKMSSRHFQDDFQRYLQDVFNTYHQVKLFLLTRLWEVFNTFLRRTPKTVIYRGICQSHSSSEKLMVSVQNLQER